MWKDSIDNFMYYYYVFVEVYWELKLKAILARSLILYFIDFPHSFQVFEYFNTDRRSEFEFHRSSISTKAILIKNFWKQVTA